MKPMRQRSIVVTSTSNLITFLSHHLTLSKWLIRDEKDIFYKVEIILLAMTFLSGVLLFTIHLLPVWLAVLICFLLSQRLLEFTVVYARNFIFNQGRIFTVFEDEQHRGEWLVMMFILNVVQLVFIFAVWYRYLSFLKPESFSAPMGILNSFYFSVVTLLTVGYGDIIPISNLAKALVIIQSALTFYIFVVVVNGLISIHFTSSSKN